MLLVISSESTTAHKFMGPEATEIGRDDLSQIPVCRPIVLEKVNTASITVKQETLHFFFSVTDLYFYFCCSCCPSDATQGHFLTLAPFLLV